MFLSLFVVFVNKIIMTLFKIEVCYCCVFNLMKANGLFISRFVSKNVVH